MRCKKCGAELSDDSLFCNKCGSKTTPSALKSMDSKKKWILISSLAVAVIALGVMFSFLSSNPVGAFEKAISDNKYGEANQIFEEKIKGDLKKEMEVAAFLQVEIDSIVQGHATSKIDYNFATVKLETIQKTALLKSEVSEAFSTIHALNDSRTAFKTGQELLKNNSIKEALLELKKVKESDSDNFPKAQELIISTSNDYKNNVLNEAANLVSDDKFTEAIGMITDALLMLNNDSDLLAKKTLYQKQHEEQLAIERKMKMEELRENQEVTVESTSTFTDWLDDIYLSIVVKNNTDKVVKKYTVGWMGFDNDGFPVKTGWISPDFLKEVQAEANIQPNKTFGSGYGWALTGGFSKTMDAATFIACVKEVEYYDGTIWENEYYTYWVEEQKEKPLQ